MAAGEVSGDAAGAGIALAIRRRAPDAALFGVGGARMQAAGVVIDVATNHLGTVGLSEALAVVPSLWRVRQRVKRLVAAAPPDAAVLIGNDVFSVLLGRWLRARGIPTAAYFPPQIWIWGALAAPISRSYDAIFACFPQEHDVYAQAASRTGAAVVFVGHHLADQLAVRSLADFRAARRALGLAEDQPVVSLLPGSRRREVQLLAPVLLAAARALADRNHALRFAVAVAEPEYRAAIDLEIERMALADRVVVCGGGPEALLASDLALMASGTASLEAALLGVPMLSVYRVSRVTQIAVRTAIWLGLMAGETTALPNLVLGKPVVPELTQGAVTPANIARTAQAILDSEHARLEMSRLLAEVAPRLRGPDSFGRTAEGILALARDHAIPSHARPAPPPPAGARGRPPVRE
jgi:lipid-A-disaccharide synthase